MNIVYIIIGLAIAILLARIVLNSKTAFDSYDLAVGLALIVSAWYASVSSPGKNAEHFAETTDNTTLDKLLQIIGIQKDNDQTYKVTDNYNENLTSINGGLTAYYSCFSKSSLPKQNKTWYNISQFFSSSDSTCPDVSIGMTHMQFLADPSYSRESGFSLSRNILTGPKSHNIGIVGNSAFSIVLLAQFESFPETNAPYILFQQHANTPGNNGVKLYIKPSVTSLGSGYAVNIVLQVGEKEFSAIDPITGSSSIIITPGYVNMFAIIKNNDKASLIVIPNVNNINASSSAKMRIISDVGVNEDILFSNKELVLNSNKNIAGNLYSVAVYNKALNDDMLNTLFSHYQTEINKSNAMVQEFATQLQNLKDELQKVKNCPYPKEVCEACNSVADWTNTNDIIANASKQCLSAIDAYCSNNAHNPLCVCWNPSNALSKSVQCQNYVNIFKDSSTCSVDKIDNQLLDQIKQKNQLCSCKDIDNIKHVLKESEDKQQAAEKKPRYVPIPPKQLDPYMYNINESDIEYYDRYSVNTHVLATKNKDSGFTSTIMNWFGFN